MATTATRVRHIIGRHLDVDATRLSASASLVADVGADSLALVELTLALEEEFEIDIPEEHVKGLQTIDDVIAYVARRRAQSS